VAYTLTNTEIKTSSDYDIVATQDGKAIPLNPINSR